VSVSLDIQKREGSVPTAHYDVVVMGAGPYGLAAAAHLQGHGLKVGVFGKPLKLWRENMPQGMLLRSYWWATNISDPRRSMILSTISRLKGRFQVIRSR
jgi:FAD-dependent urate hydroxylase